MKISIITINYNNSEGLERTINSIQNQSLSDFEYLIIDGNSTDNSVEIIEKYSEKIDFWITEPDSGVYNAMNKGIKQAKGEYLLFINSGDYLKDNDSLRNAVPYLSKSDIIYFDLCVIHNDQCELKKYPDSISMKYLLKDTLPHPASFIKKNLFIRYGLYDESYKIISDWIFFFKAILLKKATYKHVNIFFSIFIFDGMSSKGENFELIFKEKERFYYENLSFVRRIYKRLLRLTE